MKKLIFNFLFVFMMSMSYQAVAATLTLTNNFGPDDMVVAGMGTGQVVQGTGVGVSLWTLDVSSTTLVEFDLTSTNLSEPVTSYFDSINGVGGDGFGFSAVPNTSFFSFVLLAGQYSINVIGTPATAPYLMTINTPIPAAAWLFGSVVMGFFGFKRRKSIATSVAA